MENCPYTEVDKKILGTCSSMIEIGGVAVAAARRLKRSASGRPVVQVCGPMSTGGLGSLETNMLVFRTAILVARQNGLLVFDQLPLQDAMVRIINGRVQNGYAQDILDHVYRPLFWCKAIDLAYFLPTWESSHGARWERKEAASAGLQIHEYPGFWYYTAVRHHAL